MYVVYNHNHDIQLLKENEDMCALTTVLFCCTFNCCTIFIYVQSGPCVRVNYMVARPDTEKEAGSRRHEHAEKKLLDNLDQLLQTFKSEYGSLPGMALLYTWAAPCPRCTNELLKANNLLRGRCPGAEIRFTVRYSVNT